MNVTHSASRPRDSGAHPGQAAAQIDYRGQLSAPPRTEQPASEPEHPKPAVRARRGASPAKILIFLLMTGVAAVASAALARLVSGGTP